MTYPSIDVMQNALAKNVFSHTQDRKKASGRALGTIIEVITYYLLDAWCYSNAISIEYSIFEYGNPKISHNVEYALHPVLKRKRICFKAKELPLTSKKLFAIAQKKWDLPATLKPTGQVLLTRDKTLRNACVIAKDETSRLLCRLSSSSCDHIEVEFVQQCNKPYGIFECKRVGIEEGNKKGPTTIEKAKQGAYVARSVSALQRIRTHEGRQYGVLFLSNGRTICNPYDQLIHQILESEEPELLRDFVLTVGVVSNHGNWFTSGNQNKEMMVLAQSYDWLLFLTDEGLSQFVTDVLIKPKGDLKTASIAFKRSYTKDKRRNQFTKVQMNLDAHYALRKYFKTNLNKIESWFNVISPHGKKLKHMRNEMNCLAKKEWVNVHR